MDQVEGVAAYMVVGCLRVVRRFSAQNGGDSSSQAQGCWSMSEVKRASKLRVEC